MEDNTEILKSLENPNLILTRYKAYFYNRYELTIEVIIMGEINNNITGLALLLPPTPEGYSIMKPFEIPKETSSAKFFLNEIEDNTDETIILL